MKIKLLTLTMLLFIMTGCGSDRSEPYEIVSDVIERESGSQNIQLSQSQILFPYGLKATAEVVTLNLLVSTSQNSAPGRIEDVQKAIDVITELASQSDVISLEGISANQVNGSYAREDSSTSKIQNLDTSAIEMKLTTPLAQHDYDFVKTVTVFNDFLNSIILPESITVRATSVEADLGDPEKYRGQIIAQLYQELNSVKGEYSPTVKFEITGLYDPLKKIRLSDTEYYLYLEPVVTVIEF